MAELIIVPDKQARGDGQQPIAGIGQSFDIHEWSGSGLPIFTFITPTMGHGTFSKDAHIQIYRQTS